MAVVQNTYTETLPVGFPGMIANGETSNRISRTQEDATAIGFGKPVYRGAGDHGVTATSSAALLGITIADMAVPATAVGAYADAFPQYSTVGILTQGVIWVAAGANTTDGAQVYATAAGVFTPSSSGNQILAGWFFEDTVSSGALVRIAKR